MKPLRSDGSVEFRPSVTRASIPLAATAVIFVSVTGLLAAWGRLSALFFALSLVSAAFLFCFSFIHPWLLGVEVRPGTIRVPSGYGINTLLLVQIDRNRCRWLPDGSVELVDRIGSRAVLQAAFLGPSEIEEALAIFGLSPREIRIRAEV